MLSIPAGIRALVERFFSVPLIFDVVGRRTGVVGLVLIEVQNGIGILKQPNVPMFSLFHVAILGYRFRHFKFYWKRPSCLTIFRSSHTL